MTKSREVNVSYAILQELEERLIAGPQIRFNGDSNTKLGKIFLLYAKAVSPGNEADFFKNRESLLLYNHAIETHLLDAKDNTVKLLTAIYFGKHKQARKAYEQLTVEQREKIIKDGLFEYSIMCHFWNFPTLYLKTLTRESRRNYLHSFPGFIHKADMHYICSINKCPNSNHKDEPNPYTSTITPYGLARPSTEVELKQKSEQLAILLREQFAFLRSQDAFSNFPQVEKLLSTSHFPEQKAEKSNNFIINSIFIIAIGLLISSLVRQCKQNHKEINHRHNGKFIR